MWVDSCCTGKSAPWHYAVQRRYPGRAADPKKCRGGEGMKAASSPQSEFPVRLLPGYSLINSFTDMPAGIIGSTCS